MTRWRPAVMNSAPAGGPSLRFRTLSEIMTAWRRVQPGWPELQFGRLVRLQDAARQLAADIEAAAGRGRALGPALSAAGRLAAFEEDAAGIGQ